MTDADALPADSRLPHLAAALDGEHMRREFGRQLGAATGRGEAVAVHGCSIRRVKYKPGNKALVWYDLELTQPRTGKSWKQWYSARIFAPDGSQSRYRKAVAAARVRPQVGPAVIHIASMDMVAWSFPNERKLDGLPVLIDDRTLTAKVLPEVVRAGLGDDYQVMTATPSVASYAPEYTCSVRVDLELHQAVTDTRCHWRVYGKTYYDDRGASTFRMMRELHNAVRAERCALVVPRPLVYQPRTRTLWQEAVDGVGIFETPRSAAEQARALDDAARALAALHDANIVCAPEIATAELAARLPALPALLRRLELDSSAPAEAIVRRLVAGAQRLQPQQAVTLHGDLHAKNILVPGVESGCDVPAAVALIDLDTLSRGPASHDLGSWIASQLYRDLLAGADLRATLDRGREFVEAYRRHAVTPVVDDDVRWHTAAALLNERAWRTLTRLKPGRLAHVARIVELAGELAPGRE